MERRIGKIYKEKEIWKILLLFVAVAIGTATLWYTNVFVKDLRIEEKKKVELWAEATKKLANINDTTDIGLALTVIAKNTTIPVILVDEEGIVSYKNLDPKKETDQKYLQKQKEIMGSQREPIEIELYEGKKNYIYYRDSTLLTKLKYYPLIMLLVIATFILVAYLAFSSARRSEQNRVWAGMAKETAHQLGTPLSSLAGWMEILKSKDLDKETIEEIEKDIIRLNTVAERFSKIGSFTNNKIEDLNKVVLKVVNYLQKRTSVKIKIYFKPSSKAILVHINKVLFEWVLENVIKNAIDAIQEEGNIKIIAEKNKKTITLDVLDTGRGIKKSEFKNIFKPGYTSKKRGWGLGLSLANRIVSEYHKGSIKVLRSEEKQGTTIRITLPT